MGIEILHGKGGLAACTNGAFFFFGFGGVGGGGGGGLLDFSIFVVPKVFPSSSQ